MSTHINVVVCASVPSAQNDGLTVKLAPKVSDFTMDTLARWKVPNES
jgi:hypothetical protein